jgi:putative MATE family efflux protein
MMVFSSIYGVVDGFFVSNFVGKGAFSAVNFIMPVLMLLGAIGFMFGAGGSALVSKTRGEGDIKKANSIFSLIVYTSVITGILIAILGLLLIRPVSVLLGAGPLTEDCVTYGSIILAAMPFFMLQMEFQSFFITAEKPQLGLFVTIFAGVTNMVLDALFIAVFGWGIVGAALATATSQVVGGLAPILYFFSKKNSSVLRLGKTRLDIGALVKTCTNGSSELMSNISMSVVGMLYNYQLMEYSGPDGVAAYGVLMYVGFIFISIFIGYSIGTAPIIGFHYGAQNHDELKTLRKKSTVIILALSVLMLILGEALAYPLSYIFVGYDKTLFDITVNAFFVYSFSFLFAGISIFGSSFFTALNNGFISALISFLRTLLFQITSVLVLPLIWGLNGIWLSVTVAEVLSVITTVIFLVALRKRYHY